MSNNLFLFDGNPYRDKTGKFTAKYKAYYGKKPPETGNPEIIEPTPQDLVQEVAGLDKIKELWQKFKTWKEDDPRRRAFLNLVSTGALIFGVTFIGLKGMNLTKKYLNAKGVKTGR